MNAFRWIQDGCKAYLATMVNTTKVSTRVMDVPVVKDFSDVFWKELPGLPPLREVDFENETIPGVVLISIAPYKIAPLELKDLKK